MNNSNVSYMYQIKRFDDANFKIEFEGNGSHYNAEEAALAKLGYFLVVDNAETVCSTKCCLDEEKTCTGNCIKQQ